VGRIRGIYMEIDEHFIHKAAAIKDILDYSDKIYKLSLELRKSKDVKEFEETLMLIRSLSEKNKNEIEELLSKGEKK
jgi:hypothetical protein